MKLGIKKPGNERARTLAVALFLSAALVIGLGFFLLLARTHHASIERSQARKYALLVAQAGAEEALAQLDPNGQAHGVAFDRTSNGWGPPSAGFYGPKSRSLDTNTSYSVVFTDTPYPAIYSTGYVTLPGFHAPIKRVICVITTNTSPSRPELGRLENQF